jgi:hypothetical protein
MPHRWPTLTQCLAGFALLAGCHGMEPLAVKIHDPLKGDDRDVLLAGNGCIGDCDGTAGRGDLTGKPDRPSTSGTRGGAGSGEWPEGSMFPSRSGSAGESITPTVAPPVCGNGVLDPGELCEDWHLNGATCESFGYAGGGLLSCERSLCVFDVSQCRLTRQPVPSFDAGQAGPDEDAGIDIAF